MNNNAIPTPEPMAEFLRTPPPPTPSIQTAEPAVRKPDLFRQILSGALLGLGAGMAAKRPEQAFGAGQLAVQREQDRQLQRQLATQESQREQQPLNLQERGVATQEKLATSHLQTEEAMRAHSIIEALLAEKQLGYLPQQEEDAHLRSWAAAMNSLGLQPVTQINEQDRGAFLQQMSNDGKTFSDYIFGPGLKPGTIIAYQADNTKKVSEDLSKELRSQGFKVPVGAPMSVAVTLIQSKVSEDISRRAHEEKATTHTELLGSNPDVDALSKLHGEQFLAQLPAATRALVKGIADYQINPTTSSIRGGRRELVLGLVKQYDPSFDQTAYNSRARVRQDFTSGKAAFNIRSLNTAVSHLDELSRAAEGLENRSVSWWNTVVNKGLTVTGDPRVTTFNVAANAVESELASVFKGMGATDQEIKAWREQLSASQSPAQLRGNINEAITLMSGRLSALRAQWQVGMGKPADFRILSNESRNILNRLGHTDITAADTPGTPAQAAQATQHAAPQLPPAVQAQLAEGQATTFGNGQTWTLRNGQPVRLK